MTKFDESRVAAELHAGRSLEALRLGEASLPLRDWPGFEGRILAGRVAERLGAPRLARVLHLVAWRAAPEQPQAACYGLWAVARQLGPLAAWRRRGALYALREAPTGWTDSDHARFTILSADLLAQSRDFEGAVEVMESAGGTLPLQQFRLHTAKARILWRADRPEEALDVLQRALEMRPRRFATLMLRAEYRAQLGRFDEALADTDILLQDGATDPALHWLRYRLLRELGDPAGALVALGRAEASAVLAEPRLSEMLPPLRAELLHRLGEREAARDALRGTSGELHEYLARALDSAPETAQRRVIPVPFVRQDHQTCAPATLTMLARHFGRDIEHDAVVEQIWFGGTDPGDERRWAEESGYVVREFSLTAAVVRALIDRGVPFALNTHQVVSGHVQVVEGYDDLLGALLLRDPGSPFSRVAFTHRMIESERLYGPRCILLLPPEEAHRLAGLELPEAAQHDRLHSLRMALAEGDGDRARDSLAALVDADPEHPLTHQGRIAVAIDEGDPVGVLAAATAALEAFPGHPRLELLRRRSLARLGARHQRLAALRDQAYACPFATLELAMELGRHSATAAEAARCARRAARRLHEHAGPWTALAMVAQHEGRLGEAEWCLHFATCLSVTDDGPAQSLATLKRQRGDEEGALRFLRERVERYGRRNPGPLRALAEVLYEFGRHDELIAVLERGAADFPRNAPLIAYVVGRFVDLERLERATELLGTLEHAPRSAAVEHAAAFVADASGDHAGALARWQRALALAPLNTDLAERVTRSVLRLSGKEAARDFLLERCDHCAFDRSALSHAWQRLIEIDPTAARVVLQQQVDHEPGDFDARNHLSRCLYELERYEEALEQSELVLAASPDDLDSHTRRVSALHALGRSEALIAALADLAQRDPLNDVIAEFRLKVLVQLGRSSEATANLDEALAQRTTAAAAPLAVRGAVILYHARQLEHAEQAARWALALDRSSELPWRVCVDVHEARGELEAACATAREYLEAAPRSAMAHYYCGWAERALGHHAAAIEGFKRAVELERDPDYARLLLRAMTESGRHDELVATRLRLADVLEPARAHEAIAQGAIVPKYHALFAQCMQALAHCPGGSESLRRLARLAVQSGVCCLRKRLEPVLHEPGASAAFGRAWGELAIASIGLSGTAGALEELNLASEAERGAVMELLEQAAERGEPATVARLIRGRGTELARQSDLWAAIGRVLGERGARRATRRWLAGWEQRKLGLEDLRVVADAFAAAGDWQEVIRVAQYSLQVDTASDSDAQMSTFHLLLAEDALRSGRLAELRERIPTLSAQVGRWGDFLRFQALVSMRALCEPKQDPEALRQSRESLHGMAKETLDGSSSRTLRVLIGRCAQLHARRLGGLRGALWNFQVRRMLLR